MVGKFDQTLQKIESSLIYFFNVLAPQILSNQSEDFSQVTWIKSYQSGYLPKRPFGTIYIDVSNDMVTLQNSSGIEYDSGTGKSYEVTENYTLLDFNINMFGDNAEGLILKYSLIFDTTEAKNYFYDNGFRYMSKKMNFNKTTLINAKYEERAGMIIKLSTIFANKVEIDTIESVGITADYNKLLYKQQNIQNT